MPNLNVAHIKQEGIDLIIIPLDPSFGDKSDADRRNAMGELQLRAGAAGLAGTVVPVWEQLGRMMFMAPKNWHPFFQSLNLQWVWANVNRQLFWN